MSETHPPHRVSRSIGAVLAGVLAVVLLSLGTDAVLHATGVYPGWDKRMADGLFVVATAYRIVYSIAGSFIAARLAPARPMLHALVVGVIGLAACLVGAVATWDRLGEGELGPKWYPLAIIAIALPCAWAGGRLHGMRAPSHAT